MLRAILFVPLFKYEYDVAIGSFAIFVTAERFVKFLTILNILNGSVVLLPLILTVPSLFERYRATGIPFLKIMDSATRKVYAGDCSLTLDLR